MHSYIFTYFLQQRSETSIRRTVLLGVVRNSGTRMFDTSKWNKIQNITNYEIKIAFNDEKFRMPYLWPKIDRNKYSLILGSTKSAHALSDIEFVSELKTYS